LFIFGCSSVQMSAPSLTPRSFAILEEFTPPADAQKALYSTIDKTTYLLESQQARVIMYKNGTRNTVGGIGFDSQNFAQLNDIALAPDGNLLALDGFARKIKKFSSDGHLVSTIDLVGSVEPALFVMAPDETIYYYDASRREVVVYRHLTRQEAYAFGKFQLDNPVQLLLTKNHLLIQQQDGSTLEYDIFGQFIRQEPYLFVQDRGQELKLLPSCISHIGTEQKFCFSPYPWKFFSSSDGVLILGSSHKILIGRMLYDKP